MPVPECRVRMGPEILDSILSSLLDNARQHAGPNAEVRIACTERALGDPPEFEITVCDNGTGISPQNAKRIFQPFFTTRRDAGCTGLGLAIIRALLNAHRGSIELKPSEKGACFRIRLALDSGLQRA